MTDRTAELLKIRQRAEDAKRESARAEGALDAALKQLKEQYGCYTVEEAIALLEGMGAKAKKAEAEFQAALRDYEKHFG